MSFWLDNAMEAGKHILVDMGYMGSQNARDRTDDVIAFIGKTHKGQKNVEILAYNRITIRIPPGKLDAVLEKFPAISGKQTYSWCTHSWLVGDADDLKYAD